MVAESEATVGVAGTSTEFVGARRAPRLDQRALALILFVLPTSGAADLVPDCAAGIASMEVQAAARSGPFGTQCWLDSPGPTLPGVGLPVALFGGSGSCGRCLWLWGSAGSAIVRVADLCSGCAEDEIEVEPTTFQMITGEPDGVHAIALRSIECPVSGPLEWRHQGSNPFFLKLQVRNHPCAIAAVEVFQGSWLALTPTSDNHFTRTFASPLPSPFSVRAIDLHGRTVEDSIALGSDDPMPGSSQFELCEGLFLDGFESGLLPPWSQRQPYLWPDP